MLHSLNVQNGADAVAPLKFLPPNVNAAGLIVVDNVAYASTHNGCGGTKDGVWALDLETKQVTSWTSDSGLAGSAGPAFGPDGTIYVSTAGGELVALEPVTLKQQASYRASVGFASSPVIFEYTGKTLIAVTTKDNRLHLLDASSLDRPLDAVPARIAAAALSTWQDSGGIRWIAAPSARNISAWKLVERNGMPALEKGWDSSDITSPFAPTIVNGVVFALSAKPAVLYAIDGATGKTIWDSGKTIAAAAGKGGLSAGGGQIYVGTQDGTLYAFGFPMEH
jgi:outer membrane protein assembly factor BamB